MLPLADAVRSYAAQPLEFEPDSKWAYANAGHQHGRPHHRSGQRYALSRISCRSASSTRSA